EPGALCDPGAAQVAGRDRTRPDPRRSNGAGTIRPMNRRLVRRLALVAVAVACAFAAAGCSNNGSADAATIKFTDAKGEHVAHVKRDQFMQQLRDYVGNKELISAVSANPQLRILGD